MNLSGIKAVIGRRACKPIDQVFKVNKKMRDH
jgi:hypothetical protein